MDLTKLLESSYRLIRDEGIREFLHTTHNFLHNRSYELSYRFSNPINDEELYDSIAENKYPYTKAQKIKIDGTSCVRDLPNEIVSFFGTDTLNPLYVYTLNNCTLSSNSEIVTSNGRLVYNSIGKDEWLHKHYWVNNQSANRSVSKLNPRFTTNPKTKIDKGFNLVRRSSYYHWVTESLAKIRALKYYENRTNSSVPVIIESDPPNWVLEYLSLFDLDDQTIELPSESVIVKNLISSPQLVRTRTFNTGYPPSSNDIRWISQKCKSSIGVSSSSSNNRIFISREDANTRKIKNRDEVFDRLSQIGFEKHALGEYSIKEQIKLFAGAECIVGMHGAGLVNSIFSDNIKLFEIIPGSYYWHDYYCMANQLGFDYDYYRTSCQDERTSKNIHVDKDVVSTRVKQLLEY